MRAVVQRVKNASVEVAGKVVGRIDSGLLVLLGVEHSDLEKDATYIAGKIAGLRVFPDQDGQMNLSVIDVQGSVLVVSQFTLLGDVRRGKRPSFTQAAPPDNADRLVQLCCEKIIQYGLKVEQGQFRADMDVSLVNDGPVTILLDSKKLF